MALLEVNNIIKKYTNHLALDGVDLQVSEGSIYGLLGPNGGGKTTLIRIINKILAPDSGLILFRDKPISIKDVYNIGYLPEERGLYKKMKVWDHAIFLAQLKGLTKVDANQKLNYWLDRLDMYPWKDKKVEELSKGMQQKLQFLTTVIHNPDLLILDEPFSGFDPLNSERLKQEIIALKKQGKTIILSTHNMDSVEALCDEMSLLYKSKVVLSGNVSSLRAKYKKNILKVVVASTFKSMTNSRFEIITHQQVESGYAVLRLKKKLGSSNTEIIKDLANQYELISFEEELPSMNEVFIQTITQA